MIINEALFEFHLPYKGNNKTVRVFVPEHGDGERLPVIYMTDGQNLFEDDHPGQFGCWYTREAVREKQHKSGKAAIIVGIYNDEGPIQRTSDLTPKSIGALRYPDEIPEEMRRLMIPDGEAFDAFVTDTVMPEIEERFPVLTGRENTAFCGSSSGGLQAYFTVLSHPDKFCLGGVFSPAFPMYSDEDVIHWTKGIVSNNAPYLYLYSGSNDQLEQEICEGTEAVAKAISEFYPKEKLKVEIIPEQRHHETAWAAVFKELLHTFLSE
ncbi:MAG: alpha/beta hydrolase [Ruminococcus sp.]|nr:alpha/beta hydrolase [Ruminococcus sp.]